MQQTKMLAIFIFTMFVLFAAYVSYAGYVVVRDRTGMVENASIVGFHGGSRLYGVAGHYFGIPPYEGAIEVHCTDGSQLQGGIARPGDSIYVDVTGEGTCAAIG